MIGCCQTKSIGARFALLRCQFRAAAIAFSSKHKARRGDRAPSLSNFQPNKGHEALFGLTIPVEVMLPGTAATLQSTSARRAMFAFRRGATVRCDRP